MTAKPTGRSWAYAGAILGGMVSIAANVAHSYVPPFGTEGAYHPPAGAVFGAVFWPVALFVAVEILARTDWPAGPRWAVLRFLGLLPVSVVAAVVSYRHLSGLLAFYREDALTATIGPLAVDGLMVMATGALVATAAHRASPVPVPVPAANTPAAPTASSTPARTGTPEPSTPRTGTAPPRRRTGTPAPAHAGARTGTRTDAELIAVLAGVPREPDGTVPVRRAAAALSCGPDRARRLLAAQGLLRTTPAPSDASAAPVAA
jgi:hypothetical protein